MTTLCTGCFSLLAIIIGLLMIIDFIIEDLMLNSYLQKNFHTLKEEMLELLPWSSNLPDDCRSKLKK
ncbi:hypothetical protein, partial [Enterocloster clostridioformis]|uniref:hypothetical protein n=1 Tax=Enterocloster clostridioformis TaxID=1531 RepID=UPI0032BF5E6F